MFLSSQGFEEKESLIASQELRIQNLETRLEALRPKKRRKVRTSPNSKFANIKAIQQAQEEASRAMSAEQTKEDIYEASIGSSTSDYIIVDS